MIAERYCLFTRIPIYVDDQGALFANALWEKDLFEHTRYLAQLRLSCPLVDIGDAAEPLAPVRGVAPEQVTPLRLDRGPKSILANLIPNFLATWRAAKAAEIWHAGGAGWAFPNAFYLLFIRLFLRRKWVMLIESAFWLAPREGRVSWRGRLRHIVFVRLLRAAMRRADARIFTQSWYRDQFLGQTARSLIAPAIWVDEADLNDPSARVRAPGPLRLLFAARLTAEKGVGTVLEAVRLYAAVADAPALQIDIIGRGPMEAACRALAADPPPGVAITFKEPVEYGAPFFALLRGYDALVLANLTEEQPRVVFDAFGQGLPLIASATSGVADIAKDGQTAIFVPPGDSAALARVFAEAAATPEGLAAMAPKAFAAIRARSHRRMHEEREAFLRSTLTLRDG